MHPQGDVRSDDVLCLLGLIALMSVFIAPRFREKLNTQFMLGALWQWFRGSMHQA